MIKVLIYQKPNGKEPFVDWLESLPWYDQVKIRKRISRLEIGNFGDHKSIDDGVFELRFFFGSGYRVYFGLDNKTLVILLTGGNKSSQVRDIKKAKEYWMEAKNEIVS